MLDPIALAVPFFALLMVLELWQNHRSNAGFYRLNDTISNISNGMLQQVFKFAPIFLLIPAYEFVYQHWSIFPNIFSMDSWINWLLLFVAIDFLYYWFHRASHRIALLWTAHIVHHQSEEYNLSVALRQSVFQGFFSIPFYFMIAFLGFAIEMYLIVAALNTISQFWVHTRLIGKLPRPIEAILNTPSHHRVHHARNPRYIDKNYAGFLIVWDRMFGTFEPESSEEEVVYGITEPTTSWNPLLAQWSPFWSLLQRAWRTKHPKLFLAQLFYPPGRDPYTGIEKLIFEKRTKYDPELSSNIRKISILLFFCAFLLSVAVLLLANQSRPYLMTSLTAASVLLLCLTGVLLDQRPAPLVDSNHRKNSAVR